MDKNLLKVLISELEEQKIRYDELETHSLLGEEPHNTQLGVGGSEVTDIKNNSRHSFIRKAIQTYINNITVTDIVDRNGVSTEAYDFWLENEMDRKLPLVLNDFFVGGSGYFVIEPSEYPDGSPKADLLVKSPKFVTTASIDPVNGDGVDYAIEKFYRVNASGNKEVWFNVWDSQYKYTYLYNSSNSTITIDEPNDPYNHGLGFVPVFPIEDIVTSEGAIYSVVEFLVSAWKDYRQSNDNLSQAGFWQGIKQIFLKNTNPNDVRKDPVTKRTINVLQELFQSIANPVNGVIALPASTSIGQPGVEFGQTVETNLMQLISAKDSTRNTFVGLASLPLSLFDPTATPQNAEGAVQQYTPLIEFLRGKRVPLNGLNKIIRAAMKVEGKDMGIRDHIVWQENTHETLNSQADTLSKLVASGVPIRYAITKVLGSTTSNSELNELLDQIDKKAMNSALGSDFNIEDVPLEGE